QPEPIPEGDFVVEEIPGEVPTEPGTRPVPEIPPDPPAATPDSPFAVPGPHGGYGSHGYAPPDYPSELHQAILPVRQEQEPPPRLMLPALPPLQPEAPPQPPAPPPPDQTVPDWSLQEARAQLKEATVDRDRIVEVALRYGRRTFDLVAAFAVIRGAAVGWDVRGEDLEPSQ